MSNEPRQSAIALAFDRDEWELIVTLPRRVLMAAVAAAPADGRRAAEGIAGIEAIASGLASPSPLVREVVGSIYSESYHDPEGLSGESDVITRADPCRVPVCLGGGGVQVRRTGRQRLPGLADPHSGRRDRRGAGSGRAATRAGSDWRRADFCTR